MKRFRNVFLIYALTIGCFSALMYWIVLSGRKLEVGRNVSFPANQTSQWMEFLDTLSQNLAHPLALLLAQIITIIIVARILGWVCKKIGQPTVIGEIAAGILLGPSFVGLYFPEFSATLFPIQSFGNLQFLSQIGLILFMFMVGMELDFKTLKNKAFDAFIISQTSIIVPFALGMGLAYFIYLSFAPKGVQFLSFGLFIGIAMSITAFPVLARIVQERGIHKTRLGAIVITCAAVDDITAWSLLAAVIAITKAGSFESSVYIILLAVGYVLLMFNVVKPFLKRVGDLYPSRENMSKPIVAIFFLTLIISSYATEVIGIHALFGAFMAGTIMPDNMKFRNILIEKIEDIALVLLLPLFFVYTGLRTEIGLLNAPFLWKITGLIILVAVTGKFIGSALAAKFVGQNWRDSLSIGALMNTRGLMELVVLNIGYDLGVLNPQIFTMMVIMALVTTFMTGPALDLINRFFRKEPSLAFKEISQISKYKVLISFANPEKGKVLLRLANNLVRKMNSNAAVTVMHLSPNNELNQVNIDEYEHDSFAPVIEESKILNQKITTLFKVTNDVLSEITDIANKGDYDLLLVGLGQSIFEGSLLGRILGFTTRIIDPDRLINTVTGKEKLFERSPFEESTRMILARSEVPVGILLDKNLVKTDRVFIPVFDVKDAFLISYAQKLISNSGAQVTILDANGQVNNSEIKELIRVIEQNAPNHISLMKQTEIGKDILQQQDLMIISLESWKRLIEKQTIWLANTPSVLIISENRSSGQA
ncbi:MAG: cation:proton antiporter [Bacteroidia bacterium]|nr:cation:proton antiporter [Bacteroidia bacterium]